MSICLTNICHGLPLYCVFAILSHQSGEILPMRLNGCRDMIHAGWQKIYLLWKERFAFRVSIERLERNTSPYKCFLNQFDIGFNILSTESCIHFESNLATRNIWPLGVHGLNN